MQVAKRQLRYAVIAEELRRRIAAGEFRPGALLPSEAQLSSRYRVSRVTARRALDELRTAGLVGSRQGLGWYVAATPIAHQLGRLDTIEAHAQAAGLTAERRVTGFAFVDARDRARDVLGCDTVLEVRRVNEADGRPLARVTVWVPEQLAGDLSRSSVQRFSLYELLPVALAGAVQRIGAVAAGRSDARLLKVPAGTPLLWCERITSDRDGKAVLLSEAVFNPLLTEFVVELPALDQAEPTGLRLVR